MEALAKRDESTIAALSLSEEKALAIAEAIRDNLGELHTFSLKSVTVPAGGGTSWTIETIDGPVNTQRLVAVILHRQRTRRYYDTSFEDAPNQPPTCYSPDGIVGVGNPGGACAKCPLARFGRDGSPPLCSQREELLLLTPYGQLPLRLSIPPASLKLFRNAMLNLVDAGVSSKRAVVAFELRPAKNSNGVKYSEVTCNFVRMLTDEEYATASAYAKALESILATAPPTTFGAPPEDDNASNSADAIDPSI